ncbi:hypothetical protein IFM60648_09844 [Aspergillus lentulus]|uniref:Uncharacterized protein n=1 Tax=Aspergillus lentulus TaxID=293939 RepID=A0ABQ1B2W1_ASPLE|nr:hypothetical protein IFM60648_09844 [Aspergillus lentulus]
MSSMRSADTKPVTPPEEARYVPITSATIPSLHPPGPQAVWTRVQHSIKRPSLQLQAYLTLQVSTAIVVDLIEVCGLLDASFTLKRLGVGWLIFGNVVSIILGVVGCLQLVFSDWALSEAPSDYPRPWMDTLDLAFILMIPFPYGCPLVLGIWLMM